MAPLTVHDLDESFRQQLALDEHVCSEPGHWTWDEGVGVVDTPVHKDQGGAVEAAVTA